MLNQYANSLFTSFSIDSPEFEDKKGVFVFSVNGTVVYVGMTNDSLKNVIMGTYGKIIPRKLHKDGQLTACRLSAFLNKNHNKKIELWFIELPHKAIRELIINAVIHRNYQMSSSVQIAIYDDRVEISSPGSIYGSLTLEEALSGRSSIRNKTLARTLEKIDVLEG